VTFGVGTQRQTVFIQILVLSVDESEFRMVYKTSCHGPPENTDNSRHRSQRTLEKVDDIVSPVAGRIIFHAGKDLLQRDR